MGQYILSLRLGLPEVLPLMLCCSICINNTEIVYACGRFTLLHIFLNPLDFIGFKNLNM